MRTFERQVCARSSRSGRTPTGINGVECRISAKPKGAARGPSRRPIELGRGVLIFMNSFVCRNKINHSVAVIVNYVVIIR